MSDTTRCANPECGHEKELHRRIIGCLKADASDETPNCPCLAFVPMTERAEPEAPQGYNARDPYLQGLPIGVHAAERAQQSSQPRMMSGVIGNHPEEEGCAMAGCVPVAQQSAATVPSDTALWDFVEREHLTVEPYDVSCGDYADVRWRVIEHHMAAPHKREIGDGSTPREAIRKAMTNV